MTTKYAQESRLAKLYDDNADNHEVDEETMTITTTTHVHAAGDDKYGDERGHVCSDAAASQTRSRCLRCRHSRSQIKVQVNLQLQSKYVCELVPLLNFAL
jgi:hypothetical protein